MAVQFDKRFDDAILVIQFLKPFNPEVDFASVNPVIHDMVTHTTGNLYVINDVSKIDFNFSELIVGMDAFRRMPSGERVVPIGIGSGDMLELAKQAAAQAQYGARTDAVLFATLDEALAFIEDHKKSAE